MSELSVKERDLLRRVDGNKDLLPMFLRKVKGLKWFDSLAQKGYFNPEENPKPIPAKKEGYVNIPFWPIVNYLVKTTPELSEEKNKEYVGKYLQILVNVTKYAKENKISNFRTWRQFSEIIVHIPCSEISLETLDMVDYWLDDRYEDGLVAQEIGGKWLPKLLALKDEHALTLAKGLLKIIYKVKYGEKSKQEVALRYEPYYTEKITKEVASLAGEKLGLDAIIIFHDYLTNILEQLKNDSWSSLWQPAIEDHEQNKHRNDAGNFLIQAYRDSLEGSIRIEPKETSEYVKGMLKSEYQTIQRLALHVISYNYHLFADTVDHFLDEKYLYSNYRHEMWHFLNKNYLCLSDPQKEEIIENISGITREDDNGNDHAGATAYRKAIWFSAIKDHGNREAQLYEENTKIAKTEPEHPDFSSYMSVSWGGITSPKSLDDLQTLSIDQLIKELKDYKAPGGFGEPGLEGLVKTLKQLIKTNPLDFYLNLNKFASLDLAYLHEIIEAYQDLWSEKAQLPWDDIWQKLLEFCLAVISQERFWEHENTKQREHFVANRYWTVSSIGRLLEAGTKSDDHAFNEEYLDKAEKILSLLLNKETGNEFKEDSDAVSISINSPRGHCLEALINLTLRSCRMKDKKNNKGRAHVWSRFQQFYDSEIERADLEIPEYEFATLVTNYLPNFLYMSKEWVLNNLSKIFDQSHYLKWLCAMQGYSYVDTVYPEIYDYLKDHGDYLNALDDENIKDRVGERVIQHMVIAFINDFEILSDENSLISTLISRNVSQEINHLIWFMWTLRKKDDETLKNKVYELWSKILHNIDFSTSEGKRLASQLCYWAVFVDEIDDERREWLLKIAPHSNESHNSYGLLKSIAEISGTQPFEAHAIWMKMLENSTPDYPEEAVRKLLENLLKKGDEGLRKAREAEDEYIKVGNDKPSRWLNEIRRKSGNV